MFAPYLWPCFLLEHAREIHRGNECSFILPGLHFLPYQHLEMMFHMHIKYLSWGFNITWVVHNLTINPSIWFWNSHFMLVGFTFFFLWLKLVIYLSNFQTHYSACVNNSIGKIDPPSAASEEPSHKVKSKREALADCQKKDTWNLHAQFISLNISAIRDTVLSVIAVLL